jgi:hypothetical protein
LLSGCMAWTCSCIRRCIIISGRVSKVEFISPR